MSRIENEGALRDAYDESGKRVMHLQKAVEPFDLFVRCLGIGPQVRFIRYGPDAPHHKRYQLDRDFLSSDEESVLYDTTLTINSFFGWDFNSCEALRQESVFYPIDFSNACPDSQVTSLHYHFPWLVKAMLKWSLFCAATDKPMRWNLDWSPYYQIRERKLPYRDSLKAHADIGRERFQSDPFEEFCATELSELDEVAWEFFGSEKAEEAIHAKVAAIFPEHEHEEFTEHFWERIQMWRRDESAA